MDRSAQRRANEHPQKARHEPKLRREHRAYQRAWTSYGREVVAEDNPSIRRDEILPVLAGHRGSSPNLIERKNLRRQPRRVKPPRDHENANSGDNNPQGAHILPARPGKHAQRTGAQHGDDCPKYRGKRRKAHGSSISTKRRLRTSPMGASRSRFGHLVARPTCKSRSMPAPIRNRGNPSSPTPPKPCPTTRGTRLR